MSTQFPTALDTLTNPTAGQNLNSPSHSGQHADANDAIEALEAKVGVNGSVVTSSLDYRATSLESRATSLESRATSLESRATSLESGWIVAGETWTYASADDPTFTFTISGDKTTKYSPGMRIKITQSTGGTKYFIITKVAYSAPNTTVTVYGGTDYDLNNETISSPYYSGIKAPQGFPLDPLKWQVLFTDTSERKQANPSQNTWYNPSGANKITLPIGVWDLSYSCTAASDQSSAGNQQCYTTLSTANNSESDSSFTSVIRSVSGVSQLYLRVSARNIVNITTKTVYYLNISSGDITVLDIYTMGTRGATTIRAVCAYL